MSVVSLEEMVSLDRMVESERMEGALLWKKLLESFQRLF